MVKDYEDQAKQRRLDEDWKRVDETRQRIDREWQEELARVLDMPDTTLRRKLAQVASAAD